MVWNVLYTFCKSIHTAALEEERGSLEGSSMTLCSIARYDRHDRYNRDEQKLLLMLYRMFESCVVLSARQGFVTIQSV